MKNVTKNNEVVENEIETLAVVHENVKIAEFVSLVKALYEYDEGKILFVPEAGTYTALLFSEVSGLINYEEIGTYETKTGRAVVVIDSAVGF